MLTNMYLLANIGADAAENERIFAKILTKKSAITRPGRPADPVRPMTPCAGQTLAVRRCRRTVDKKQSQLSYFAYFPSSVQQFHLTSWVSAISQCFAARDIMKLRVSRCWAGEDLIKVLLRMSQSIIQKHGFLANPERVPSIVTVRGLVLKYSELHARLYRRARNTLQMSRWSYGKCGGRAAGCSSHREYWFHPQQCQLCSDFMHWAPMPIFRQPRVPTIPPPIFAYKGQTICEAKRSVVPLDMCSICMCMLLYAIVCCCMLLYAIVWYCMIYDIADILIESIKLLRLLHCTQPE